jgi:hypothetical protein
MEWSGRAPALPATNAGRGHRRQGARHVAETRHFARVIGIDIGKNSFHIVGQNQRGAIVLRQKWSRGQVEARLASLPPCRVGMEACVGTHHLSRTPKALGHDARLMPAKYVRSRCSGDAGAGEGPSLPRPAQRRPRSAAVVLLRNGSARLSGRPDPSQDRAMPWEAAPISTGRGRLDALKFDQKGQRQK